MNTPRLIAVALVLCAAPALACSCGWPGYANALPYRSVAFEGVPEGEPHEFPELGPFPPTFLRGYGFFVRVTRVFKGTVAPTVFVASQASSCGHLMKPGTPYVFVIYPYLDGIFSYETHGCDGTAPLAELTPADLAILGPGTPPTPRRLPWVALGAVLTIILLWLRRLRRQRAK